MFLRLCEVFSKSLLQPPERLFISPLTQSGPFVYRLGRQVFNLKRGVRLPYGLPLFLFISSYLHKTPLTDVLPASRIFAGPAFYFCASFTSGQGQAYSPPV